MNPFLITSTWKTIAEQNPELFAQEASRFLSRFTEIEPHYARFQPGFHPIFMNEGAFEQIASDTLLLTELLFSVPERMFGGDYQTMLKTIGYSESDIEFLLPLCTEKTLELARLFSRIDFVVGEEGLKVVECNVGATIGGMGVLDRFHEMIVNSDLVLQSGVADRVRYVKNAEIWANAIKHGLTDHLCYCEKPVLVFVSWEDELDLPHTYEAAYYLEQEGIEAHTVLLQDLEIQKDCVFYQGTKVDVVYGCFTFDEIRDPVRRQIITNLLAVHQKGNVLFLVPPSATIYGNKAMLALLSAAQDLDHLSNKEREVLNRLLPPTRIVSHEVLDWAIEKKEQLVLKPAVGHGGSGVIFGRDLLEHNWLEMLQNVLKSNVCHVLQVVQDYQVVPMPEIDGIVDYKIVIGGIRFGNQFGGFFVRVQPCGGTDIINMAKGSTFSGAFCIT